MATSQCLSWERPSVGTVFDDNDAVDDDVLDAYGIVFWILAGGMGLHRLGIEHDDIRLKPVAQQATVRKAGRSTTSLGLRISV